MNWKLAAVLVMTAVWLYQLWLSVIRLRSAGNPIPASVADVYDPETYQKWRAYHSEKGRFAIFSSACSFAVDLLLILFNAYALFAGLFPNGAFMQSFAVMLLSALSTLPGVPFAWHDTMVIEQKYGFNRTDKNTFISDQIKSFLIGLILLTGIAALLMGLHRALGDWLIAAFAAVMTLFALMIAFLYPVLSRIFNKFSPLEDEELKNRLTALLEKNGYHVRAIRVMDASKRSTRSNAYFTGFGRSKTVVLYDTLLNAMTPDEICAVFAHEMGHGLHKDTLKNQLLTLIQMAALSVLAWLTLRTPEIFASFGFDGVNYGFALILIMSAEFALIAPLFALIINRFMRKAEYRADAQAVSEGYGDALVSALKKLARENFAELAPSPLLVKLEYSHPPLSERIRAIRELQSKA